MQKVLIFHGWWNTNNDQYACTSLLSNKLKSDWYDVVFDTINYTSWISIDEILDKYPDDYDIVIWHSAGGFLALQYSQYHHIQKLILIAPCTSTKNFTDNFIAEIEGEFNTNELQIFNNFHDHGIKHVDVNNNCENIIFVFGKFDESIDQQVADIYYKIYPQAEYIFLEAWHMGDSLEDWWDKILEIYDKLILN